MGLLKLTLANGKVIEIDEHEENAIRNSDELRSLFNGTACIYHYEEEGKEDFTDPEDMLFELEVGIDPAKEYDEPYQRITKVKWNFADHYMTETGMKAEGFKGFVEDQMNEHSEDDVYWCYDVANHGCASGTVGCLIYTSDCLKVLAEHSRDIEGIIQEIGEDLGAKAIDLKDFTFDKLVWMCFEQTLRDALQALYLEDI